MKTKKIFNESAEIEPVDNLNKYDLLYGIIIISNCRRLFFASLSTGPFLHRLNNCSPPSNVKAALKTQKK